MCGNRTELCTLCNQYVTLATIEDHSLSVHGVPFQAPIGIPRIKSDNPDTEPKFQLSSGLSNIPDRDYDKMLVTEAMDDTNPNDQDNKKKKRKMDLHIMPIYESA